MNHQLIHKRQGMSLSHDVLMLDPYNSTQIAAKINPKSLKSARDDLTHYQTIWQTRKKRRTVHAQQAVEAPFRRYQLTKLSWKSLGQLLLEALDDLLSSKENELWSSYSIRQESIQIWWEFARHSEKSTVSNAEANVDTFQESNSPAEEIALKPAEPIEINQIDSFLLPERRKSKRHQDRLREEHHAALKIAKDKDIAFQLGKFIGVDNLFVDESQSKTTESDYLAYWKHFANSLTISHKNEQFWLCIGNDAFHQCRCFTVDESETEKKIPVQIPISEEQENICSKHVVEFFHRIGRNVSMRSAHFSLLETVYEYLVACGHFAHTKLQADDTQPLFRDICIWAHSLLDFCFGGKTLSPQPKHRFSVQFDASTDDRLTLSLPFQAKVFLLELDVDQYLTTARQISRKRTRPNQLIAKTQTFLMDFYLGSEKPGTLLRLFWILGSLYEGMESWEESTHYFSQCLAAFPQEDFVVRLPHRSLDPVISAKSAREKLQAMAFTTQYAHAKVCFHNRQYTLVVQCLRKYFFPANAQPQWDNILVSNGRQPLRLFWNCVRRSGDTNKQQSMLGTLLFQLVRFVLDALQTGRSFGDFSRALNAIEWLLRVASRSQLALKQSEERQVLESCCITIVDSLVILLLSTPSKAFERICSVLTIERAKEIACRTLCRLRKEAFVLDSFVSGLQTTQQASIVDSYAHNKEQLMLSILEVSNETTIDLIQRSMEPENPPSNAFLLECCRLMKEEERKSNEATAALFLQAAIAFILVQWIELCAQRVAPIDLIDSVAFLHDKLASFGQCCSTYGSNARSFASVSLYLLEKLAWKTEPTASTLFDPQDRLLEAAMAQCFMCLYDVQLLPNLNDHHTKRELSESDRNDVLRLSQFAFRILLTSPPKSTWQKRENTKLLSAIRDALTANAGPGDDPTLVEICKIAQTSSLCLKPSEREFVYMYLELDGFKTLGSPDALWKTAVKTVDAIRLKVDDEKKSNAWYLSHLWFLLGENDSIPRRNRGSATDLSDLRALEVRMKRRLLYFLTDVLQFHPERRASWVEISRLTRDLYLSIMDTMLVFFGRQMTLNVLQALWKEFSVEQDVVSIAKLQEIALHFDIFEAFDEWKRIRSHNFQQEASDLERNIGRCCLLFAEVSRRSCMVAAALGDPMRRARPNVDMEARHTTLELTIECLEEAGLLLYGLVQDTALSSPLACEESTREDTRFPMQLVRQALWVMDFGLQLNDLRSELLRESRKDETLDAFAYEMAFRLEYVAGKLAKKLWKWNRASNVTQAERILRYWVNADRARVLGKLEQHGYGLLHAFYAIQAFRLQLLLSFPDDLKQLELVLMHHYTSEASVDLHVDPSEKVSLEELKLKRIQSQPLDRYSTEMIRRIQAFAYLNVLNALESVRTQDRYFHSAHFRMAKAYHHALVFSGFSVTKCPGQIDANALPKDPLSEKDLRFLIRSFENRSKKHSEAISEPAACQLQLLGLSNALECMASLFDKKRSQVVAVWFTESIAPIKRFDALNQRQAKYDGYRLRYWAFYLHLLQQHDAYGRLNELTMWAAACKEQHDVVGFMLESVFHARANVLDKRYDRNGGCGDDNKALSKAYGFYIDVSASIHRIGCTGKQTRLKERSEKLLVRHLQCILDKGNAHEWSETVLTAREYCEALWPERVGKSKHVKLRSKNLDGNGGL
uniref:Exonuclease 1 putative n=1 Tax=Albugo laibachii Nc14 TaxID=890382 RepID=F0W812_9STRA|nr:exonuclease 1 putative [Albugo laibachii Nc14]|eukprot:CCA17265.1 exonuclease 1 putative [Albugo laibachii Nc14]